MYCTGSITYCTAGLSSTTGMTQGFCRHRGHAHAASAVIATATAAKMPIVRTRMVASSRLSAAPDSTSSRISAFPGRGRLILENRRFGCEFNARKTARVALNRGVGGINSELDFGVFRRWFVRKTLENKAWRQPNMPRSSRGWRRSCRVEGVSNVFRVDVLKINRPGSLFPGSRAGAATSACAWCESVDGSVGGVSCRCSCWLLAVWRSTW